MRSVVTVEAPVLRGELERQEAVVEHGLAGSADRVSGLADLDDMDLADLLTCDNPVLLDCLRRVREEADKPQDIVAGFQSAI
jgi:FXSXX-COOH protein